MADPTWEAMSSGSSATDSGGTFEMTEPTGSAEGDLLIAAMTGQTWSGDLVFAEETTTTWTEEDALGANAHDGAVFSIVRGASAPELTFDRGAGNARINWVMYRISSPGAVTITSGEENDFDGTTSPGTAAMGPGDLGVLVAMVRDGAAITLDGGLTASGASAVGDSSLALGYESPGLDLTWDPGDFTDDLDQPAKWFTIRVASVDTTVTVHKTTGDYSTVQSAVDDCSVLVGSGWYKVNITDAAEYSENVDINGEITTPTISHYLWLTAASGVRHAGIAGTGHARITASWYALSVRQTYTRVDWLELISTGTTSYEALEFKSTAAYSLVSYCLIRTSAGQDFGVRVAQQGDYGPISLDNCVVYGADGAGIGYEYTWGTGQGTLNVDHCTIVENGLDTGDAQAGAIAVNATDSAADIIMNVYNTVAADSAYKTDFSNNNGSTRGTIVSGGTLVWNGADNCHTTALTDMGGTGVTDNITNWNDATGGLTTTTTTATAIIVTNETAGSENYTPVAATGGGSNILLTNGTNRIGSEPDARQDFSTDIAGNTRPTTNVDIGAFQISAAGGGTTLEQEGFRFYEATSTEGTNALAAQDVNITRGANETVRLRTLLNATGDPASTQWKLQFRDPTGTWRDLGAGE